MVLTMAAMITIFVRVCRTHRVELVPDTLVCPIGHECGENDFLSRERRVIERTAEQSRAIRDGLVWAAGVFDAHGYCSVTSYAATKNGKRYRRLQVHIRAKEQTLPLELQRLTGLGSVVKMKARPRGAGLAAHGPSWRFHALNSSATRFLLAVKPYLRLKKNAVDKLLQSTIQGRCE